MIGDQRHRVVFQNPADPVPDGRGGYSQTWTDADPPTWYVSVTPAAAHDLEYVAGGASVITSASHIIRGRYHPNVSTKTRMVFNGRTFAITGTRNVDERSVFMELTAVEMVQP
jgi:head-tail adaptor